MISCIAPQTQEQFKQYYSLRWQELRSPWRQPKGSEQDELEAIAFHRMLVDEQGKVYAVGRLHIDNEWLGHIRYVATDNNSNNNDNNNNDNNNNNNNNSNNNDNNNGNNNNSNSNNKDTQTHK